MEKGGLSVLLLEDENMISVVTAEMIRHLGHTVITCNNGEAACCHYKEASIDGTPFDVVIMDLINDNGMGGLEAAQQILRHDPKAQLIACSGYIHEPVMEKPEAYGFQTSMPKPYTLKRLRDTLQPFCPIQPTQS